MANKKPPKTKKPSDVFTNAAIKLLKSEGWIPVVVGGITVEQQAWDREYAYRLIINFTGKKVRS